jgi:hypothetical protein
MPPRTQPVRQLSQRRYPCDVRLTQEIRCCTAERTSWSTVARPGLMAYCLLLQQPFGFFGDELKVHEGLVADV